MEVSTIFGLLASLIILLLGSTLLFYSFYKTERNRNKELVGKYDRIIERLKGNISDLINLETNYKLAYITLLDVIKSKPVALAAKGLRTTYEVKSNIKTVCRVKTKTAEGIKNVYHDATLYLQLGKQDYYIACDMLQHIPQEARDNPTTVTNFIYENSKSGKVLKK